MKSDTEKVLEFINEEMKIKNKDLIMYIILYNNIIYLNIFKYDMIWYYFI